MTTEHANAPAADALLPCPLCGGQAGLEDCRLRWVVRCTQCSCCVLGESSPELESAEQEVATDWSRLKDTAIAAWNRRASSAPAQEAQPVFYVAQGDLDRFLEVGGASIYSLPVTKNHEERVALYAGPPPQAPSAPTEAPLSGRWRHGNGAVCCGSLRVLRVDFDTAPAPNVQAEVLDWLCAALNAAQAPSAPAVPDELARIKALLQEPAAVHVAMLRGEIAKPDVRTMLHVYGEDALRRWDSAEPTAAAPSVDAAREVKNKLCIDGHLNRCLDVIWRTNEPAAMFARLTELAHTAVDLALASLTQTAQAAEPAPLTRDRIREIFMAHGFTIKEGQTDLKDYVYEAAEALFRAAEPAEAPRKDAERYAWLKDRFLGADFNWGDQGKSVLLIEFDGEKVWGSLDLTVDAAIDAARQGGEHG